MVAGAMVMNGSSVAIALGTAFCAGVASETAWQRYNKNKEVDKWQEISDYLVNVFPEKFTPAKVQELNIFFKSHTEKMPHWKIKVT